MKTFKETRISFTREEIEILDKARVIIYNLVLFMEKEELTSIADDKDNIYFDHNDLSKMEENLCDLSCYPELLVV